MTRPKLENEMNELLKYDISWTELHLKIRIWEKNLDCIL